MAKATLNAHKDFPVGTAGQDATGWKLLDGNTDSANVLRSENPANNPAALRVNQFHRIRTSKLSIAIPAGSGGGTEEFAKEALKGALKDGRYLALYDVNDNTDRRLTNFVAVNLADWTIA